MNPADPRPGPQPTAPAPHPWRNEAGEPWSLTSGDTCAVCGSTPDTHRPDEWFAGRDRESAADREWLRGEARQIVERVGGPGLAYHTRVRREKELTLRLVTIWEAGFEAGESAPPTSPEPLAVEPDLPSVEDLAAAMYDAAENRCSGIPGECCAPPTHASAASILVELRATRLSGVQKP